MNKPLTLCTTVCLSAIIGFGALTYQNHATVSRARAAVTENFNDPSSAQFRHDSFHQNGWYCGEVNSKNLEGAYVGFKRYASSGPLGQQFIEGEGLLGKLTTEDLLNLMAKKIARLKSHNAIRARFPDVRPMPESEVEALARNDIFVEKWTSFCQ